MECNISKAREHHKMTQAELAERSGISRITLSKIENGRRYWPVFYAIDNQTVVGWSDVSSSSNPRLAHRGFLGMGVIEEYRGKGIGSQLLSASIEHSKKVGLEKIELSVYTSNEPAIRLYKRFGFREIGIIKHYRKLDGQYFDCVEFEKFL